VFFLLLLLLLLFGFEKAAWKLIALPETGNMKANGFKFISTNFLC
jgi:hypothetical protein